MKNDTTPEQIKKLVEDAKISEWLTPSQIARLYAWQYFKPRKITVFIDSLRIGKATIIAFRDAENA